MHDDWTKEDRAQRERLERNSSAGQRVNMAAALNTLVKVHDARAMPGLGSYAMIRLLQGDNRGAQAGEARRHNRSHEDYLARRNIADADGAMHADARTVGDKWDRQGVRPLTLEEMQTLVGLRSLYSRYF